MTKEEINKWFFLNEQFADIKNEQGLSKIDWQELVRLNHLVMETAHHIHNVNMIGQVKA